MEASRSLGFLGSLPIETFCAVIQRLNLQGLQDLLRTYPQYQGQILSCLTQFPSFEREEEFLSFLRSTPGVSLSFPPSFFRTTRRREIHVPDSPTLQFLSRQVRGDLSVRWEGRGRWEEWEERTIEIFNSLLDIFSIRTSLYPESLTSIHLDFAEPEVPSIVYRSISGSVEMRYHQESLILTTEGTFRLQDDMVDIIEKLPIRDLMVTLDNPTPQEVDALADVFARGKVEIYRIVGGAAPVRVLDAILTKQREKGRPPTIRTLVFSGNGIHVSSNFNYFSTLSSYPGVQSLQNIEFLEDREWRKFLPRFPDLRSLSYYPNRVIREEEIQAAHPSLQIIRLEPLKPEERPSILQHVPIQLLRPTGS